MEYDRKYIRPENLKPGDIPGLNDDTVLEIVGDEDGGFHFESNGKGLFDDLDLGLIPYLLKEPDLLEEVTRQMERGEIVEVGQSTNPRVQALIEQYQQRAEAAGYHNPYLDSPLGLEVSRNPLTRAFDSLKRVVGSIFSR